MFDMLLCLFSESYLFCFFPSVFSSHIKCSEVITSLPVCYNLGPSLTFSLRLTFKESQILHLVLRLGVITSETFILSLMYSLSKSLNELCFTLGPFSLR